MFIGATGDERLIYPDAANDDPLRQEVQDAARRDRSGVVEAGCRTVVGKRLKQSGMFWSEQGATCVLNFRTLLLSQRFDAFWIDRVNARAAENDPLPVAA